MMHAVPPIRCMGKGTEGLQKMRHEFKAENKGMVIPTQVRCLANPHTICGRRQNRAIDVSSVVSVVKGNKLAQSFVMKDIKAAGVWYQVETYTNEGHVSRCELCCGRGNIKTQCGSKPKGCYCSGYHWTSDHKCNAVGCTAMQGSLCGHMLEMIPNCKGNHITCSSRCVRKRVATKAKMQRTKIGLVGRVSTSAARGIATGSTRVVLGPRPQGVVEGGGDGEENVDVDKEHGAAGNARVIMMAETDTATTTASDNETQIGTGALAPNHWSDQAKLR